ncbi:MCE family protein [Kaustia mangrovi]|uniref:MCE family protein n=1 Tax=Kaustia mangrovi TaxID=2593653 RepID=A0A7S8C5J6_9HYPH|nr:MlaD family protein [Kaustia mangrovi]QPC43796.1 MCE family protein [Kaustia mangrovi]
MKKNRAAVAIGSFILGGGFLLALGIVLFGGIDLFSGKERAVIYFDTSISGLQVGAPVAFQGVTVGSVQRIALEVDSTTHTARIPVYIEIKTADMIVTDAQGQRETPDIEELVQRGMRAQLQTQSFVTGRLMVELDFTAKAGPIKDPWVDGLARIPSEKSALDQLKEQVSELGIGQTLATAKRVLQAVDRLANTANKEIVRISNSVVTTTDDANRLVESLEGTVKQLSGELKLTLKDLRSLANVTRDQVSARGDQLGKVLTTAEEAAVKIEATAANLDKIAANVNQLVAPRGNVRTDLESGLRDLSAAASSLRSFAREIERNPNALLLGSQ